MKRVKPQSKQAEIDAQAAPSSQRYGLRSRRASSQNLNPHQEERSPTASPSPSPSRKRRRPSKKNGQSRSTSRTSSVTRGKRGRSISVISSRHSAQPTTRPSSPITRSPSPSILSTFETSAMPTSISISDVQEELRSRLGLQTRHASLDLVPSHPSGSIVDQSSPVMQGSASGKHRIFQALHNWHPFNSGMSALPPILETRETISTGPAAFKQLNMENGQLLEDGDSTLATKSLAFSNPTEQIPTPLVENLTYLVNEDTALLATSVQNQQVPIENDATLDAADISMDYVTAPNTPLVRATDIGDIEMSISGDRLSPRRKHNGLYMNLLRKGELSAYVLSLKDSMQDITAMHFSQDASIPSSPTGNNQGVSNLDPPCHGDEDEGNRDWVLPAINNPPAPDTGPVKLPFTCPSRALPGFHPPQWLQDIISEYEKDLQSGNQIPRIQSLELSQDMRTIPGFSNVMIPKEGPVNAQRKVVAKHTKHSPAQEYLQACVHIHLLGLRGMTYLRTMIWDAPKIPPAPCSLSGFILQNGSAFSPHNVKVKDLFVADFIRAARQGFYRIECIGGALFQPLPITKAFHISLSHQLFIQNSATNRENSANLDQLQRQNARRIAKWLALCQAVASPGSKLVSNGLSIAGADICSSEESDDDNASGSNPVCFITRQKRWRSRRFQSLIDHLRQQSVYPSLSSSNIIRSVDSNCAPPANLPFVWVHE